MLKYFSYNQLTTTLNDEKARLAESYGHQMAYPKLIEHNCHFPIVSYRLHVKADQLKIEVSTMHALTDNQLRELQTFTKTQIANDFGDTFTGQNEFSFQ